jgi:TP901 family phage tail tape measure protein
MADKSTVGKLIVELLLKDDQFKKALDESGVKLESATGKMGAKSVAMGNLIADSFKLAIGAMTQLASTALKTGAEFEQAMATLGALAGVKQGTEGFAALEEQARFLGATTLFTATQAAEGLQELARAGLDVEQAIKASNATLVFAGATGMDMAQSAELMASAMAQFQLPAEEAGRIVDVYTKAMNTSLLSTDSLREAMKYAGTVGAAFGNSIEETTAAVAQFRNLGLEGSMAGTNLRMSLAALLTETDRGTAALKKYGLAYADLNPETHKISEILNAVAKSGMSAGDAIAVFGERAGANIAQIGAQLRETFEEDGSSALDRYVTTLENSIGSTESMYDTMLNTLNSQTKILVSAFEDFAITAFEAFGEPLTNLIVDAQEVVGVAAEKLREHIPELRSQFELLFGEIGSFIKAEGPDFIDTAIRAARVLLPLVTATVQFAEAVINVVQAINKLNPSLVVLNAAMDALAPANAKTTAYSEDHAEALFEMETQYKKNLDAIRELEALMQTSQATRMRSNVSIQLEIQEISKANDVLATGINVRRKAAENTESSAEREIAAEKAKEAARKKELEDLRASLRDTNVATDEASNKFSKAFDAFNKAASEAVDAYSKAGLGEADALVTQADERITKLEQLSSEAVSAARAAGVDTTQIETDLANSIRAIQGKLALDLQALEDERVKNAQKTANEILQAELGLAQQRGNIALEQNEANVAGLDEREQMEQDVGLRILDLTLQRAQDMAGIQTENAELAAIERMKIEERYIEDVRKIQDEYNNWLTESMSSTFGGIAQAVGQVLVFLAQQLQALAKEFLSMAGNAGAEAAKQAEEFQAKRDELRSEMQAAVAAGDQEEVDRLRQEMTALQAERPQSPAQITKQAVQQKVQEAAMFVRSMANNLDVLIQAIAAEIPGLVDVLIESIPVVIQAIADNAAPLIVAIVEQLPRIVWELTKLMMWELPKLAAVVIWELLKALGTFAAELGKKLWEALSGGVADFVASIGAGIASFFTGVADKIMGAMKNMVDKIKGVLEGVGGWFKEAFTKGSDGKVLGLFSGGIDFVPTTSLVKVHPGEAIIPADRNPFNPGAGSTSVGAGVTPMSNMAAQGGSTVTQVNVMMDSRLIDGVVVRGSKRGNMPNVQRMIRKGKGTRIGLDRRNFQSFVS